MNSTSPLKPSPFRIIHPEKPKPNLTERKTRSGTRNTPSSDDINKDIMQSAISSYPPKINSQILRPFVVLKTQQDLLGKRPLSEVNALPETTPDPAETAFEIHTKIIKGNSTEIKLQTNPTSVPLNGDSIVAETLPREAIQLVTKSPEPIDFESNHSTNDDPIEESTEDNTILNNFKIPDYILDFQKKYRLYSTEEKRKQFFASYKPGKKVNEIPSIFDVKFTSIKAEPENHSVVSDFTYDLELVTNKNEREKIKVSFQPGKVNMVGQVPNKMDTNARDSFFKQFHFTTDYRSGYAPIDIQAKQEEKEFSYKDHFIKKKQASSSARLKRTCGVSYVKALESHQLHVDNIFAKLPPLVFQGSTECTRFEEGPHEKFIEQVFENVFKEEENKFLVVTTMEAEDENLLREYLYYPERRLKLVKGNVYLAKSLDSIWGFFKDKMFVCIHMCYDEKEFIRPLELKGLSQDEVAIALAQSNIQLGIICKKSTSGKKAFLKVFVEGTDIPWNNEGSDSEDEAGNHDDKEKTQKKPEEKILKKMIEKKPKKEKKEKTEKKKKEKEEDLHLTDSPKAKKGKKKNKVTEEEEIQMIADMLEDEEDEPRISAEKLSKFSKIKNFAFNTQIYNRSSSLGYYLANHNDVVNDYLNLKMNKKTIEKIVPVPIVQTQQVIHSMRIEKDQKTAEEIVPVVENQVIHSEASSPLSGFEVVIEVAAEDQELDDHEETPIKEEEDGCCKPEISIQETQVTQATKTMEVEEEEEIVKKKKTPKKKKEKKEHNHHKEHKEHHEEEKENRRGITNEEIMEIVSDIKLEPGVTLTTMSTRFELYTQEESWKSATSHTKNLLYTFITYAIDALQERFRVWTKIRKDISASEEEHPLLFKKNKDILSFHSGFKYDEATLKNIVPLYKNLNWNFDPEIKELPNSESQHYQHKPANIKLAKDLSVAEMLDVEDQSDREVAAMALPLYQISTRDSFAYDLVEKVTFVNLLGRKVKKTEYFFDRASYPYNFKSFADKFPDYRVGITTYNDFYTHEELTQIESKCYETERKFFSNHFLPMTGQMTCTSEKVRRTKFFFGARYMWTRQQLSEAHSMVGAGIRVDVTQIPQWMKDIVEKPMVDAGIMEKDFVNSIAMNVYHDGKEGIAQHFDDAVRFKQPIYSVRIFSDSRLSFGSQLYGFCNGAFCIPMPRGCITIMEEDSYAANGIKHCVRPCDMTGKSAAIILRQMHHRVFNEAKLYDEFVDFPTWFSTLAIQDESVSYADQKRIEGEEALKGTKKPTQEPAPAKEPAK